MESITEMDVKPLNLAGHLRGMFQFIACSVS